MDRYWEYDAAEGVFGPSGECLARAAGLKVAVVGGGLGGLMAARTLARWGVKVTVYEARAQVGGRVLSDSTFAKGRITEAGAELVGSIHTRWCALAKEYGLSLISRMDGDLYHGQQLAQRLVLDKALTRKEIVELEKAKRRDVLEPMARLARDKIQDASKPWIQPDPHKLQDLHDFDKMTVGEALTKLFGVAKDSRLWKSMDFQLANDNAARLGQMNFLSMLCLVRGGQAGTIAEDPLMGYWDELEIYRCGDGCQRLALTIAADVHARKGCRVIRSMGLRRIDLRPKTGGVLVTARSTKNSTFDQWLREKIPANPLMDTQRYDCVIFAAPPSVWHAVEIVPHHPKDVIGMLGMGPAVKFFSKVKERFWISDGFAPHGGSLDLGQVWEGTDNQTRVKGQDIVLSVFAGARTPPEADFKRGLTDLYKEKYKENLRKTMLVDWTRQPFIGTGYASPRIGQVLTIGKELNEPFLGRLFFAGEHTQMDHFGYMEGAIRSGERAAGVLLDQVCKPLQKRPEQVLVAATGGTGSTARAS